MVPQTFMKYLMELLRMQMKIANDAEEDFINEGLGPHRQESL